MSVNNEFEAAGEWLEDEVDYDTCELAMLIMGKCIEMSPVHHPTPTDPHAGGQMRGNWILTVNKKTDKVRDVQEAKVSEKTGKLTGGTDARKLAVSVVKRAKKSGRDIEQIYIQNNLHQTDQ